MKVTERLIIIITLFSVQATNSSVFSKTLTNTHAPVKSQSKTNTVSLAKKHKYQYSTSYYLIPPPPAYTPLVPELSIQEHATLADSNIQEENPYSKYFYFREGFSNLPKPLQTRSGVATW